MFKHRPRSRVAPARPRRGEPESISVIVSSYNQPRSLTLALNGLAEQSVCADEIVIADDGSGPETFAVIEALVARLTLPPVYVVTQADEGFRKTVALNRAILASRGQQLLFLDGDVLPSVEWVARHRVCYRPMGYAVGDYVRLELDDSEMLYDLRDDPRGREARMAQLVSQQARYLLRRHAKACFHIACRKPTRPRLLGGNFSVDRGLLFGVNGFDERFVGVGGSDSNLRNRFNRYGGRPTSVIRNAVGLHMHPRLDFERESRNRTDYLDTELRHETTSRRAQLGLAERMCADNTASRSAACVEHPHTHDHRREPA